ncbi:MAG: YicC/YloC family endoribonuclease [Saprospiraceae bacterium]
MLLSMTGFGKASSSIGSKNISVELRSLNSKVFDLRLKVPSYFKEKELDLRRIMTEKAERGKVDLVINVTSMTGEDSGFGLNVPLFKKYCTELTILSKELGLDTADLMQSVLRMPNVIMMEEADIDEEEWSIVNSTLEEAVQQFVAFRHREGQAMENALKFHAASILENLDYLKPFEEHRVAKVRQRILQNLDEFMGKENVDKNRFEQEVLFYLEKIDITEEKIRLAQHCKYFIDEMAKPEPVYKGRMLNFVSQEIGREINTLGAKAYDSDIQHYVVKMKDDLEKIKELLANIA